MEAGKLAWYSPPLGSHCQLDFSDLLFQVDMIGQGSPSSRLRSNSARFIVLIMLTLTNVVLNGIFARSSIAQEQHEEQNLPAGIRLRISWGGGEERQWTGTISVIDGHFSELSVLGLTADAPGSVVLANGQLHVSHWTPVNYGGADISLSAGPESAIKLDLYSNEEPEKRFTRTIPVTELVSTTINEELDPFGNRLAISRVPGDLLPVSFKQDHLVFSPGEEFAIGVRANRTGLESRTTNCQLSLQAADRKNGSPRWSQTMSIEIDGDGSSETSWLNIPVPDEEGVYNLQIELEPSWYQVPLKSAFQVPGRIAVKRTVQFVVIAEQPLPVRDAVVDWALFTTIDPTDVENETPFSFSQISRLTGREKTKSLGNELRQSVVVDGNSMMELLPGGWQAIPIHVDRLNRPHILEIEFLADQPTALGVSLLQTDAAGQIPLYGFDSGVVVPNSIVRIETPTDGRFMQKHRVVFWPQNENPYLLLANRHATRPATIGAIKIFSGPQRLPAAKSLTPQSVETSTAGSASDPSRTSLASGSSRRKFMAFYESPLFPESFGAREKIDPNVGQPLDDWRMFYQGADRFVQYLKANAYQGAFITVACDGSAIYPSRILGASPKHDSGTFFSNGQDPIRKDVLEMLFRMFEREGLVLVPTLAMSGPLPAVEESRMSSEAGGQFEMVSFNQSRASTTLKNELPVYNPLSRQVQKTVTEVVAEIAQRYGSFRSFQGLGIVCRPDTYTLLPGRQWGYDAATTRQFLQSQSDLSGASDQWNEIQAILLSSHQDQWVKWRARQMTLFYQWMLETMRRSLPDGQLFIAPVDIFRNEELNAALSPSLHSSVDFSTQMLQMGLEAEQFAATDGLELLQPHRISPNESLAANRVETDVTNSRQAAEFFLKARTLGDIFTHRISWAHFAQFQKQNPFGQQETPIMRLQQLTPAAYWNRQRFLEGLRKQDSRILIDGGWMIAMGQEEALASLIGVFSQLPNLPFLDVGLADSLSRYGTASMPVTIRQVTTEGQSYFYAVNASPWPAKVQLALAGDSQVSNLQSLSDLSMSVGNNGDGPRISFDIPPFSLAAGRTDSPCEIANYEFELPADAANELRKQVFSLQSKLSESSNAAALAVLENADFELFGQPSLKGWDHGQQSTAKIQLDSQQAFQGRVSLGMNGSEDSPVWIRSNVFEVPQTGRLSISVWLRTDDPQQQPPLRLAVEGKVGESNYYRFGSVGSLSPNPQSNQLGEQWQRFAVHFDDLPVDRLSNLRIGFDLMGPGNVYVDKVEVFDRWFDENDAKAITQRLASCGPLLSNPATFESCRRLLGGYWLRFLDENFGQPELPTNKAVESATANGGTAGNAAAVAVQQPAEETRSGSVFRRFRKFGASRKSPVR